MRHAIDLTGQRFGRLTVERRVGTKWSYALWECRCDCGNVKQVATISLRNGDTRSCGCYMRERTREAHKIHGESKTRLYAVWKTMLARCSNPNAKSYADYGGRGISVCDEWHDYEAFKEWAMASGYRCGLSIERENVNGNYCPENCSWIPMSEQAKNRRSNVRVEYNGKSYILSDLAKLAGIDKRTMRYRLVSGWSIEDAVERPIRKKKSRRSVVETETAAKEIYANAILARKDKFVNDTV